MWEALPSSIIYRKESVKPSPKQAGRSRVMKFTGLNIVGFSTFALMFYDGKLKILNNYFIQFSLKEMWLKPHKEYRFDNGSYVYGWLFFYFGNIISGNKEVCQ